ncbi:MAG: hypothetical protein ACREUX_22405 [Burkholderiales bacterium]
MIYMVEHTFSMPELEDEWNTWYAGNLHVLLSVPGIESAQRFRIPDTEPPRFMAMYTVAGPEVFDTDAYRSAGGGGANSVRFRPAYQLWIRNIFAGIDVAPEVKQGECLLSIDADRAFADVSGIALQWGRSVALHKTTPLRGLAVVAAATVKGLPTHPGLTVYEPHGARLSNR